VPDNLGSNLPPERDVSPHTALPMVGFPPIPPYLTPSSLNFISFLQVLGKGSFGKVMLVRFKGSRELYAMKTLRKEALIRRSQLAHTSTERYILQHIHHPFLMRLSYAFQTKQKLYMVMQGRRRGKERATERTEWGIPGIGGTEIPGVPSVLSPIYGRFHRTFFQ